MTEGFIRQRRNLAIANILLLCLATAGIQISEASLAGFNFKSFDKPEVVFWLIWAAWAYFLYRYFLYFLEEAPDKLGNAWYRNFNSVVSESLFQYITKMYGPINEAGRETTYEHVAKNDWLYKGQAIAPCSHIESHDLEEQYIYFEQDVPRYYFIHLQLLACIKFLLISKSTTDYLLWPVVSIGVFIYCGLYVDWTGALTALSN